MLETRPCQAVNLDEIYAPIVDALRGVQFVFEAELSSDQPLVDKLCRHVAHYHGKLLRPALVLLCGQACGPLEPAHQVIGAVVEMVHIATLVHDDILDDADTRRRVPTVNRLVGNERAVLHGDFLISHAFHLCSSLDTQHASRRIGATTNEVCEGEMMQVAHRGDFDLSESLYLEIIRRKTASLIAVCCELGGWCSRAEPTVVESLRRFGESVGTAFQIVDDLLDLTGTERAVGKSLGRDWELGKLTLPLIHCRDRASRNDRERLSSLMRNPSPESKSQLLEILRSNGSLEYAADRAGGLVSAARDSLATLGPSAARSSLEQMAEFVIARQR